MTLLPGDPMNACERLALAALAHDLPGLLQQLPTPLSTGLRQTLDLARLDDAPVLAAILEQAEAFACEPAHDRALVANQALISIFSRIVLDASGEPAPVYRHLAPLPATS